MTENTNESNETEDAQNTLAETESVVETPETPETPEADETKDEAQDETAKPARQAAKYRSRLRDAEAQRDAMAENVEALQRQVIEGMAAGMVTKPEALWRIGLTVSEMLDEHGTVDREKVAERVQWAATQFGLRSRVPHPDKGQGARETVPAKLDDKARWTEAMNTR